MGNTIVIVLVLGAAITMVAMVVLAVIIILDMFKKR